MWRKRTWIYEPSLVVRPQDWVMTDKLVIAYSSVWPLARCVITGISFPPIPWPMTAGPPLVTKVLGLESNAKYAAKYKKTVKP